MAHRTFVDRQGVQWQVWDVRPTWAWADRRHTERRRRATQRDAANPERRKDERRGSGSGGTGALPVGGGFDDGWLTFEADGARRRLAPIPEGWETLPELTLAELCRRSVDVGNRPRLIE